MESSTSIISDEMESTVSAVDNFYTPANHEYYARSSYCDLDTSTRQIRLLEIHRTGAGEALQLRLLAPRSLTTDQPLGYCAISYFAGNHKETELVYVNGIPFNAFRNLARALRQVSVALGNGYLRGLPTLVWADQICINQSNLAERSHQVGFMREIYQSAHTVLAFLGCDDPSDGKWVQGAIRLGPDAVEFAAEYENEAGSKIDIDLNGNIMYINNRPFADFYDENFRQVWVAFKSLLVSEWWMRGWVHQEVVCAKDVVVLFGSEILDWNTISIAAQSLEKLRACTVVLLYDEGKPNPDDDFIKDVVADRRLDFASFMSKSRLTWCKGNKKSILELFEHAQQCRFTDLRDQIYAFVGLTDPGYAMIPDYQKDLAATYRYTTKRIILYEGLLNIMCFVVAKTGRELENLPSWAPDWSKKHFHRFIYDSVKDSPQFRATSEYKAAASFHSANMISDAILRIQGLFVDSLSNWTTSDDEDHKNPDDMISEWFRIAGLGSESSTRLYPFDMSIYVIEALWRVILCTVIYLISVRNYWPSMLNRLQTMEYCFDLAMDISVSRRNPPSCDQKTRSGSCSAPMYLSFSGKLWTVIILLVRRTLKVLCMAKRSNGCRKVTFRWRL